MRNGGVLHSKCPAQNLKCMRMNIFLLLIACSLLPDCRKEPLIPDPPQPPCDTCNVAKGLEVVWQQPLKQDTSNGSYGKQHTIVGNDILITTMFGGVKDILRLFDGQTGAEKWSWYDPAEVSDGELVSDLKYYNGKILICSYHDIIAINPETGMTIWKTDTKTKGGSGGPRISVFDDHIYHQHHGNNAPFNEIWTLVRSGSESPNWDTLLLFNLSQNGNYTGFFESIARLPSLNGDTIVFFQNRQFYFDYPFDNRLDLYAYNITQKRYEWVINDPEPADGNSSVGDPLIYDGKLYFRGGYTLFCIDIVTGEILWKRKFDNYLEHLVVSALVYAEGKLILQTAYGYLYALNPKTGSITWKSEWHGGNCKQMIYYKGNVYFASGGDGKLHAVRVSDGRTIWKEKSPNAEKYGTSSITTGIAINEQLGYLYTTDDRYLMCIKLPD